MIPKNLLPSGQEIARACENHGVARLVGSATTSRFDPVSSDLDFLVDFLPGRPDRMSDYFGLREELVRLTGRSVDLVVAESVRNPYFRASSLATAEDVYAA